MSKDTPPCRLNTSPGTRSRRRDDSGPRPKGRELALGATETINREVFESLGLAPDRLAQLFDILSELRADAGDF
jgi:hypothetical protein